MSIDRSTALFVEQVCRELQPRIAVECGTGNGVSLCALARHAPAGCVIWTIDGQEEFIRKGRERLATIQHKVDARFIHAPIQKTDKSPKTWWYDPALLGPIEGPIDLLFVDGPEGTHDRSPALPFFMKRLAPKARIYLDDCKREQEAKIFWQWDGLLRTHGVAHTAKIIDTGRGIGQMVLQGK